MALTTKTTTAASAVATVIASGSWTRDQCVTLTQLRTGHSPLLAGYLYWIGRRDSAICPHCNEADEMAEHLVLQCPAHNQA